MIATFLKRRVASNMGDTIAPVGQTRSSMFTDVYIEKQWKKQLRKMQKRVFCSVIVGYYKIILK